DDGDNQSIEVGAKFQSDTGGYITGIRFYKSAANTGIHRGNLWSSTGTLLATATFTNESNSGWQQVFFDSPVLITANTTYVASYFAPAGRYSGDAGFFTNAGVDTPPLHALANGVDGANGIYLYGSSSTFPTNSGNGANYWVDVIYSPSYSITGTITGPGGAGATINAAGPVTTSTTTDASGNYSFSFMTNGSYTLTPNNTGFAFTPQSQSVLVNGSNAIAPVFVASAQTFTLSGTISGTGGSGATVSLSGVATATTTADTTGSYSFAGLANGSYTVAPTKSGFTITPSSQPVTISGANATANFAAVAQTFTLSGIISGAGGSGATVSLSGAATATTTADTTGSYSFAGLVNGSYTVAPTKSGFIITPSSQPVTISGTNATANFSSAAQTFTITGTISGSGGAGATVKLTGASTLTATANSAGAYTFSSLTNGSYTVTPTKAGYIMTPEGQTVTLSGASKTANFASAQTYSISGTISGSGRSGATVTLTGATTATTTTSTTGVYSFLVTNGSYVVTPSKVGFSFTPGSQTVIVSGGNKAANFSSAVQTFTITGTISGSGGAGATVKLTGASTLTTTANSAGAYTFSSLANGSYTVTPFKSGYIMTPAGQSVNLSGTNKAANFSSAAQTFTISGTISGGGRSGATVKLTGTATATTTSSSSGAYSFTGVTNGSYTVTPSKSGHLYTPGNRSTNVNSGNVTGLNFSSF
ncbi:MAG: DUF4082 domain-containing protein, partial [Chthonomonadales bacterium]